VGNSRSLCTACSCCAALHACHLHTCLASCRQAVAN
jgi:hypothetical protein